MRTRLLREGVARLDLRRGSLGLAAVALLAAASCTLLNPLGYLQDELGDGGLGGAAPAVACDATKELCNATAIAAGTASTCAVLSDGSLACWGDNTYGQLGVGVSNLPSSPRPLAMVIPSHVDGVAAGVEFTCAWLDDGTVRCFGANSFGELARGSTALDPHPETNLPELLDANDSLQAKLVRVGYEVACAIGKDDKTVLCWGTDDQGQAGQADLANAQPFALEVMGLSSPLDLAVGTSHACAIAGSPAEALCWGSNVSGALGGSEPDGQPSPNPGRVLLEVAGSASPASIAAGENASCVVDVNGIVTCWGDASQGATGQDTGTSAPHVVDGLASGSAKSVSMGSTSTCVLAKDGTVACFGTNDRGQLGRGTIDSADGGMAVHREPMQVPQLTDVVSLSVGERHACAIQRGGRVVCWGANGSGQLGNGSTQDSPSPAPVSALP
jgi:alpha-tubulin suppressor-like RCC1 family protein